MKRPGSKRQMTLVKKKVSQKLNKSFRFKKWGSGHKKSYKVYINNNNDQLTTRFLMPSRYFKINAKKMQS